MEIYKKWYELMEIVLIRYVLKWLKGFTKFGTILKI